MKWQPIETAPKDGTVILGWRRYPVAIRWHRSYQGFMWHACILDSTMYEMCFTGDDQLLTHWMPLPNPPDE